MDLLLSRYPGLQISHLRELAQIVARERNMAMTMTAMYPGHSWARGGLAYEATMRKLKSLSDEQVHAWLHFVQEVGLAYLVEIDGVPLRIQRDDGSVRPAMANERRRIRELRVAEQTLMFPEHDSGEEVLRLEIDQEPGKPVSRASLSLLQEHSGATLDQIVLYDPKADDVRKPELPPQDPDVGDEYEFVDSWDEQANDG